jgi:hypothetical protein
VIILSKNFFKQLIFSILSQIFREYPLIHLTSTIRNITTNSHHGLDLAPKWLAGLGHGGPWEVDHHLCDLDHQQGGCYGGLCLYPPYKNLLTKNSQEGYSLWTCSMGMGCSMSMGMNMQHGHGHAE